MGICHYKAKGKVVKDKRIAAPASRDRNDTASKSVSVRTKKQEPSNQKPEKTNQQHSLALSD